jgi:hypothetical protein
MPAINESPKCRRFQFSLRTLIIAVTLLSIPGGYVARQAKIVNDRRAMRAKIDKTLAAGTHLADKRYNPDCTIPWIRALLGDEPIDEIDLPITVSREDRDRIRAVFPEAHLLALKPTRGYQDDPSPYEADLFPEDQPSQ